MLATDVLTFNALANALAPSSSMPLSARAEKEKHMRALSSKHHTATRSERQQHGAQQMFISCNVWLLSTARASATAPPTPTLLPGATMQHPNQEKTTEPLRRTATAQIDSLPRRVGGKRFSKRAGAALAETDACKAPNHCSSSQARARAQARAPTVQRDVRQRLVVLERVGQRARALEAKSIVCERRKLEPRASSPMNKETPARAHRPDKSWSASSCA